jgi:hypothetical protein
MIARHGHSPAAILGQSGLVAQLTKRVAANVAPAFGHDAAGMGEISIPIHWREFSMGCRLFFFCVLLCLYFDRFFTLEIVFNKDSNIFYRFNYLGTC